MTSNDLPASAETQSHKDRPRTVTVTEQDKAELAKKFCLMRGVVNHFGIDAVFPCVACQLSASQWLASLPDAPTPKGNRALAVLAVAQCLGDAVVAEKIVAVVLAALDIPDAPPSAPDIEAIQELAARHCTGTPDCPVPHGAVDRLLAAPPSLPPADNSAKVAIPDAEPVAKWQAIWRDDTYDKPIYHHDFFDFDPLSTLNPISNKPFLVLGEQRSNDGFIAVLESVRPLYAAPERDGPEAG